MKAQLSLTTEPIRTVIAVTAGSSLILVHVVDGGQFHAVTALSAGPIEKKAM
jgi:hypothetical protein